jgi:hypothetical protein
MSFSESHKPTQKARLPRFNGGGMRESAFKATVKGRNSALMVIPSPMFGAHPKLIGDLAARHRLATTSILSHYTEAGLLMSYGPKLSAPGV